MKSIILKLLILFYFFLISTNSSNAKNEEDIYKKIDLQYYDPKWAKGWTRGVGSFSKVNHFNWNPQWNEHVVKETIECMTLNELIKKYKVQKIDFLKIDTEGTEYQILNNYNWQIMPSILKVEHKFSYRHAH